MYMLKLSLQKIPEQELYLCLASWKQSGIHTFQLNCGSGVDFGTGALLEQQVWGLNSFGKLGCWFEPWRPTLLFPRSVSFMETPGYYAVMNIPGHN